MVIVQNAVEILIVSREKEDFFFFPKQFKLLEEREWKTSE